MSVEFILCGILGRLQSASYVVDVTRRDSCFSAGVYVKRIYGETSGSGHERSEREAQ